MNKILVLYKNEMIKISRRPAVFLTAAVTMCISLVFPFLIRIMYNYDAPSNGNINGRDYYESQLKDIKIELDGSGLTITNKAVTIEDGSDQITVQMTYYTGDDVPRMLSTKRCLEDILKDYDFERYPIEKTWLSYNSWYMYRLAEEKLINLEMMPFEERDAAWLKEYNAISFSRGEFRKALMKHNYLYYGNGIENYELSGEMDSDDKVSMRVRKLAEFDPEGELGREEAEYLMGYVSAMLYDQKLLDSGLDEPGKAPRILSEERKEILRNSIKILEYKFENRNTYDNRSSDAIEANNTTGQIARYGLVILAVLIAGSSISQEMATGSIKSLIIAPVKRWKIHAAKLFSIITWMFAASVAITVFSVLGTGMAFGFGKLPPYLYVAGGKVMAMQFPIAKILIDMVQNIPVFFYALAAFMISGFTKNTGVSVGVSAGMILFHEVPSILESSDILSMILDFTPAANMDLTRKLFPYISLMVSDADFDLFKGYAFDNPLWFSMLYLLLLTGTILLISYDEFTKKDIL